MTVQTAQMRMESPRKRRSREHEWSPPPSPKRAKDISGARRSSSRKDRSTSPDDRERKVFQKGAAGQSAAACAICLGRQEHDYAKCVKEKLWDGTTNSYATRGEDRKLTSVTGNSLCFQWQLTKGCSKSTHLEKHRCSGCGSSSHGAQKCPRAERL
jgi:hypothetical protein